MSRLLTDDSEVVVEQSGETEEAMKQEGLLSSTRKVDSYISYLQAPTTKLRCQSGTF